MSGGILLVDKPGGITSHDVVGRARKALGTRKVGHAGTLDPMATGLLILGVDSSTRLLTFLVGLGKTYEATIRLGQSSDTDDAEGQMSDAVDSSAVTRDAIDVGIAALTGEISQVPSTFSAIKVDGKRSYELARSGEAVELKSRAVTVSRFERVAERRDGPFVDLDVIVDCSSGTYIRALARDLGAGLGVGGHLTALRRTSIGPFEVADAVAADTIDPAALHAPAAIAEQLFPRLELELPELTELTQGKRIMVEVPDADVVAAVATSGRLAGLVSVKKGVARVLVNFPTAEVLA
ncbi:tRNA pseudouridine(55) synthase TruB [soil metagenome]